MLLQVLKSQEGRNTREEQKTPKKKKSLTEATTSLTPRQTRRSKRKRKGDRRLYCQEKILIMTVFSFPAG